MKMIKDSVSIHTATRGNRVNFLKWLVYMISTQEYDNIIEWVIGDGSQSEDESQLLKEFIYSLQKSKLKNHRDILIKYIPYVPNSKIGAIRQRINDNCEGEYIISMDDDDYYPPTRVSHAISKMKQTGYSLSGSSEMYLFDTFTNSIYLIYKIHDAHCTHNTLGYTKEYARNHKYDTTVSNGEEKSFLDNYKHKMVQLVSLKTILHITHGTNTYNKRQFILNTFAIYNREIDRRRQIIPQYLPKMKIKRIVEYKSSINF